MKGPDQILESAQSLIDEYLRGQKEPDPLQGELPGIKEFLGITEYSVPAVEAVKKLELMGYEMSRSGDFVTHSLKLEHPVVRGTVLRLTLTEHVGKVG